MNPELARKTIVETFREKFDDDRFLYFIRNLVNHLDESKKQTWTLKKAAFEDFVNHFTRLGTYTDPDGEKMDVLVIHLRKNTTLSRGRVTLRNFVADYLATGHGQGKAAVMAAFVSPQEDDWRFSFVKLDYTFEKTELGLVAERIQLTPARRYSYLVGKNENCHTAQKQFLALLEADQVNPSVAHLEAAFSVEKVTKEFYEQYKGLFEKTRDALAAFLESAPSIKKHFAELGIECDDFAKKLLGQIVFLYFLQKKGWFGVERGKPWGSGRKDFIRHLFKNRADYAHTPGQRKRPANFFNDILEPLFYEAIAAPRTDEDHYYSRFDCKIPFLNGGLFEPLYGYNWVETEILLPDTLFANGERTKEDTGTGILDVFDRYNFTVNEAEPLEKEVAVDPEMLGLVFENLLPENIRHSSGTYYTPRVIVHYMCQQALLHYLTTRAADIPEADLTLFLRLAERFTDFQAKETKKHADKRLPDSISRNAKRLDELLATITVCDLAIGSGAFAVGMMHEIVRARMALAAVEGMPEQTFYHLKRHAIQHSLYGVDLDPGAVEIAKLRLWLSMVVDEENLGDIQPLPNLDYKIMQGNSLLEEFDGVRLLDDKLLQPPNEARNSEIAGLKSRISSLSQEFVRLHGEGKKSAAAKLDAEQEIKRLKKRLAALVNPDEAKTDGQGELNQQTSWTSLKRIQELHKKFFDEDSRTEKDKLRRELDALEWDFMEATLREQGREEAIAELKRASATHRKPFFLWRLHFAEVFQQRGGFDVVIANPPYVRADEQSEEFQIQRKRILACGDYETLWEKWDLYVAFIERGFKMLRQDGVSTMIVSDAFCHSKYAQKAQKWFLQNSRVLRLDFCGDLQIFDAAVHNLIFLFQRSAGVNHKPERHVHRETFGNVTVLPSDEQAKLTHRVFFPEDRVADTFNCKSVKLGDVCYISVGMVVHADEKVAKGAFELEDLVADSRDAKHPCRFVEGKHLSRWLPHETKWLEWGTSRSPDLFRRPTFSQLYAVPEKIFIHRTAGEGLRSCYDSEQTLCNHTVIVSLPWHALHGVRNKSLKKSARYRDEKPPRPDLPKREELEEVSRRFGVKYLLGVMNSSAARNFLRSNRRSNTDLYPDDWKKLPIPAVPSEGQKPVERLVEQILSAKQRDAGADVTALERELDELVYALYALTPDEIKLVQGAAK